MFVDRVLFPVQTLGPGDRVALWTAGCGKRCEGCANPELWQASSRQEVPVSALASALRTLHDDKRAHRLTVTGGDPLEQFDETVSLLRAVREDYDDVLLYTGFQLAGLDGLLGGSAAEALSPYVDVLIDGRYVDFLNDGKAVLRGSTNQVIHFLNEDLVPEYDSYLKGVRSIQNFVCGGRVISVGIHGAPEEV